ncbi:flavodoxin [Bacillus chungangensis]|uniref:Ribonucleotide reductase-associated flavodoxin n=1 Tax=Bacillus chungangensis TaxID=587633 RepID=A0ABT9WMH1_9BACI|nr:flavodoxin [Bacillus chungangensis]MDQ0174419.1 putative ribonucleotide reductase-associated flavodoxin [Bacillus chungangensis]
MVKVFIAYASLSGNTEEVAHLIGVELTKAGHSVDYYRIWDGASPPDPSDYNVLFLGSYTWGKGATPDEVKDFVADIGYKPEPVYVFGTGDTQFGGDDLFCKAAVKLARFYNSPAEPLKIEQSPRGSQEEKVREWVRRSLSLNP